MSADPKPFAYWLVPEQNSKEKLSRIIKSLAAQHRSTPFDPHLTLYFGTYSIHDAPLNIAHELAQKTEPISLHVDRVKQDNFLFKSLFIQFFPHPQLTNMHQNLVQRLHCPGDYQLDPHLSLMYTDLATTQKQAIMDELALGSETITFDSLKIVTPNSVSQDWSDIAGWHIGGEWKLTGGAI